MGGITSERGGAGYRWAIAAIVIAAIVLRWRAFSPFEIGHADELMQYLEQGNRLATGQGIVPWEYRYGARNALIAQLLSVPLWLGHALAPGTLAGILWSRACFVALSMAALAGAWRLGALTSRRHALVALFVAAAWYESVLFSELLLSEVLATALLTCAAALLLDERARPWAIRAGGLLLGLGVIVRLQYAPSVAVLAILALGKDRARWLQLIVGGLIAAAVGAVSDLAMGRVPFAWIWVNFAYNLGEGRAARFGAEGPLAYAPVVLLHLGSAAVLIVAGAAFSGKRYRPLVWAVAANFAFHSLVAHKEYRFIWLSVLLTLVLAAIASVDLAERLLAQRERRLGWGGLALIMAFWALVSVGAEAGSGGSRSLRGGAPIALAGVDAARHAEVCGIALPNQWRAHLVPALLPRDVPLYVADAEVLDGKAALPADLSSAASALIFPRLPTGAVGYKAAGCRQRGAVKACLYLRPGTCSPAPYWTYQAALEREDL